MKQQLEANLQNLQKSEDESTNRKTFEICHQPQSRGEDVNHSQIINMIIQISSENYETTLNQESKI